MKRTIRTPAIVLRSFRYGEADRIIHLLSPDLGRIAAISKGVRRTRSRLGGRLEPLSSVDLMLHQGSGELATITGADLVASHDAVRSVPARLGVALVGTEAVLRLFPEAEANQRVFDGLARFLDVLEEADPAGLAADPGRDPLALAFCLKLIALAGWAPRLDACAACGRAGILSRYSVTAGGAVCDQCDEGFQIADATLSALAQFLALSLEDVANLQPPMNDAANDVRRIVQETIAEHSGGALKTLRR
jgi:DNA repair protein RecO (recombination protein O)